MTGINAFNFCPPAIYNLTPPKRIPSTIMDRCLDLLKSPPHPEVYRKFSKNGVKIDIDPVSSLEEYQKRKNEAAERNQNYVQDLREICDRAGEIMAKESNRNLAANLNFIVEVMKRGGTKPTMTPSGSKTRPYRKTRLTSPLVKRPRSMMKVMKNAQALRFAQQYPIMYPQQQQQQMCNFGHARATSSTFTPVIMYNNNPQILNNNNGNSQSLINGQIMNNNNIHQCLSNNNNVQRMRNNCNSQSLNIDDLQRMNNNNNNSYIFITQNDFTDQAVQIQPQPTIEYRPVVYQTPQNLIQQVNETPILEDSENTQISSMNYFHSNVFFMDDRTYEEDPDSIYTYLTQ